MPRVRLTGLFLFITSILLGLAVAATQTSHIRFKKTDGMLAATDPETGLSIDELQFVSVPVIYPLAAVGAAGLLLWFVPAALPSPSLKGKPKSAARPAKTPPKSKGRGR